MGADSDLYQGDSKNTSRTAVAGQSAAHPAIPGPVLGSLAGPHGPCVQRQLCGWLFSP